jgi:hypothetical protein
VVERNDAVERGGHIVVVKSYVASRGAIATVEAAGGIRNTVSNYERPLFEPDCAPDGADAAIRPDLYALRFKATPPKSCPLKTN